MSYLTQEEYDYARSGQDGRASMLLSQGDYAALKSHLSKTQTKQAITEFAKPDNYFNFQSTWESRPEYSGLSSYTPIAQEYLMSAPSSVSAQSYLPELTKQIGDITDLSSADLAQLRNRAFGTETSAWAQKLLESQGLEEATARDTLGKQFSTQAARQRSELASRGGLSSGAAERLGSRAAEQTAMGMQGLARQGALDRLGILTQEEQNRLALQQQMPSMQLDQLRGTQLYGQLAQTERAQDLETAFKNLQNQMAVQQFNVQQKTGEKRASDTFELEKWKEAMAAAAAERTAQGQEKAASESGLCFITTAVCQSFGLPDNCYALSVLRKFRDEYLLKTEQGIRDVEEYYIIAPKIVAEIDRTNGAKKTYRSIYFKFLKSAVKLIEKGNYSKAYKMYRDMVYSLKSKFLKGQ